jgi:hypothetical protein
VSLQLCYHSEQPQILISCQEYKKRAAMSTLAYLFFITGLRESLPLTSFLLVSLLSTFFACMLTTIFFPPSLQRIYRSGTTRSKAKRQVQSEREPKKSHEEDGASTYPIENYLFVMHSHYPLSDKGSGASSEDDIVKLAPWNARHIFFCFRDFL